MLPSRPFSFFIPRRPFLISINGHLTRACALPTEWIDALMQAQSSAMGFGGSGAGGGGGGTTAAKAKQAALAATMEAQKDKPAGPPAGE